MFTPLRKYYNPIIDYTDTQNEGKHRLFFRHEISNSTSTYAHWEANQKNHKNYVLKPDHNPH